MDEKVRVDGRDKERCGNWNGGVGRGEKNVK
jgi:hypothetical protein